MDSVEFSRVTIDAGDEGIPCFRQALAKSGANRGFPQVTKFRNLDVFMGLPESAPVSEGTKQRQT